jgi:hypothetical protein
MMTPPSVCFGATDVVIGVMIRPATPDDEDVVVAVGAVSWRGNTVVVSPSGRVVMIGVVTPVGSVRTVLLFEMIVCPAEFVVYEFSEIAVVRVPVSVSVDETSWIVEELSFAVAVGTGVIVVDWPFGSVVSIGVEASLGIVTAPLALENTVSPAEFVVVMTIFEGVIVAVFPLG